MEKHRIAVIPDHGELGVQTLKNEREKDSLSISKGQGLKHPVGQPAQEALGQQEAPACPGRPSALSCWEQGGHHRAIAWCAPPQGICQVVVLQSESCQPLT